ncbi:Na+ dependent nucleoside transporter [Membranicola marinus]|uniref:Na+ dependent nucleoside transporter n=1 Tax=Membranihabitans marinus TaxID=1227546 RepID=A0A953L655_9BACT|nr:nucleoside transporter C-terminal domain-containing protein [Membranihabitans marinus]MBY5957297.1 Na+ dependent nucleoside transporter [Membranihabitans marinus]
MTFEDLYRGLIGMIFLLFICYLFSRNRKNINWRLVIAGIFLQIILAILILQVPFVRTFFEIIVNFFVMMIEAIEEASIFLFGDLARPEKTFGFAFTVLPTIIFFSALSSLLYYLGILQKVVYGFAWLMNRLMELSGRESLAAAANVFIGQTEAPLVIKPYLEKMTRSEIMCLMTGGMATIAGGVFGAYLSMLGGDSAAEKATFGMHLLTASIISAPAAIIAAKMLVPENEPEQLDKNLDIPPSEAGSNVLEAITNGTTDGLKLAVNVGAMLLAFMAFVFFINHLLGWAGDVVHLNAYIVQVTDGTYDRLSLEYVFGLLFSPISWMIGVPGQDIVAVGQMLGEKTILNEFFGYLTLTDMKNSGMLQEKSIIIATYALCGFANFASIGIQIGGIGAIAPGQKKNLTQLGVLALVGGTVACLLTATIAGVIVN